MRVRDWRRVLDYELGARLVVRYTLDGSQITNYAVVLVVEHDGSEQTVRVYDGAHGVNDMHRHTRSGGKAPAEHFHGGTLAEGMRIAVDAIQSRYTEMIDGWRAS